METPESQPEPTLESASSSQPSSAPGSWPRAAIVVVAAVSLVAVAATAGAVALYRQNSSLDSELEAVEAELESANVRIDDLEVELDAAQTALPDLGDLFSGDGPGLGDLFGEEGPNLGDLFGGDLNDLLGGLLGGLFGGNPEDLGGIEDLFSGLLGGQELDVAGLSACMTGRPGSIDISSESLDQQVTDVSSAVSQLRQLDLPESVQPTFVTPDEMARRVEQLFREEYPAEIADVDARVLVALGAIPVGYDLVEGQVDLLGDSVAGYYDPETGELVVATPSSGTLGAIDQMTLAHELTHAVTDGQLGFPEFLDDPAADPEAVRASQALIEGDATLAMQQFSVTSVDLADQFAMIFDPRVLGAQAAAADVPYVLSASSEFAYLDGMAFVCHLYQQGGWEAVDRAYGDLPTSTDQIMFPDRYLAGVGPADPADPGAPGPGWNELRSLSFGALDLLMLFSAPGDDTTAALDDPRGRAEAWAGGEAVVWEDGTDTALGVSLVDSGGGSARLCDSMVAWETAAFPSSSSETTTGAEVLVHIGQGRSAVISCAGDLVRIGIAPSVSAARAMTA